MCGDALWANDTLREQFIAENPAQLSDIDLALVESWQYRVAGDFYIVRALQRYTVFLSATTPAHVYGVYGLVSPIEETFPFPLPMYVKAVLLPFERCIIYDSLLSSYNLVLGPGIRSSLQDQYRVLQEKEGIITCLSPEDQLLLEPDRRKGILARNQKVFTAFRRELRKAGLSDRMVDVHAGVIVDFAHNTLLEADTPRGVLELTVTDIQEYMSKHPGEKLTTSFKRFTRFLLNTGRIDYDEGEKLWGFLNQKHLGE